MRVLILCTDSFGGHGGIALYNRDLAEALSVHELMDEMVIVPRVIRSKIQPPPENATFVWKAARGRAAYLASIASLVRERNTFDLVLCTHVNLLPFARMFTDRIVLFVYGIEAWKPIRGWSDYFLDSVSAVVSISDVTLRRFLAWSGYDGATYLLPNAIHIEWYGLRPRDAALARRFGVDGRRVLLTLGRLEGAERYKGFDEVLEVLPELTATHSDVVYVIAGSGNDRRRLEEKARSLGITDHVVFTGMIDEAEKAALFALADVYVMPSRGEGFGYVLLEAMASGVPVIASKHDGGYEAIRGGMLGRAVDPSNPAEILVAIEESLTITDRRMPAGLGYFDFQSFTTRAHSIIDQLTWVAPES